MRTVKNISRAKRAAPLLLAAAAAVWPAAGFGATDSFTAASGSDWNTAGNWSGGIPTGITVASITESTGNPFTVLFDDPYTPSH